MLVYADIKSHLLSGSLIDRGGRGFSSDNVAVFLAVVDHGSFSAAARALGRVPSAVSMAIASLEAELDLPPVRPQRPRAAADRGRAIAGAAGAPAGGAAQAASGPGAGADPGPGEPADAGHGARAAGRALERAAGRSGDRIPAAGGRGAGGAAGRCAGAAAQRQGAAGPGVRAPQPRRPRGFPGSGQRHHGGRDGARPSRCWPRPAGGCERNT